MINLKNWWRKDIAKFSAKNPGVAVLIPTIILSGLILVVSLGLSRVLMRELEFSADLLFGEKAYYAAESAVETALFELKQEPLNNVETYEVELGNQTRGILSINNKLQSFGFSLDSMQNVKFELAYDEDETLGRDIISISDFEVKGLEGNKEELLWKILCQKPDTKKTVSLSGNGSDFGSGEYDEGGVSVQGNYSIGIFLNGKERCFMSLINSGQDKINGEFVSRQHAIGNPNSRVRAVGSSFSREKIVVFNYLQKNLSTIFDSGFFFFR